MILKRKHQHRQSNRSGISMLELIVGLVAVTVIMSLITTLCFRISGVWKGIRQQRIATTELSNQLERLTRLEPNQIQAELTDLEPSGLSQKALRQATLTGETKNSPLGTQVILKLNWKKRFDGPPMELSGWVAKSNDAEGEQ